MATPVGNDETLQLCESINAVNLEDKDNDSAILDKCQNSEQSNALSEEVTLEVPSDPCYEVLWRQLEEELKKNNVEERIEAGDASASVATDADQLSSTGSSILLQEEAVMDKFQMPLLDTFYADLSSTRTNKIVSVYPLSEENLSSQEMADITKSEWCTEYRVRHIQKGMDSGNCFLSLYFSSKARATEAIERLKKSFPNQNVEFASQESQINKSIASWTNSQQPDAQLPDCALLVRHVGITVTVDKLKEIFPTAEDVVLPREKQDGKGPLKNKGYAYAVFLTPEAAHLALESCTRDKPELDSRPLKVSKYFQPKSRPDGLLTLVERKIVLKQGAKASSIIEKKKKGDEVKAVDSWQKKLQTCLTLIKRDNEVRLELGLPVLSYDDLCAIKDLPALDSKKSQHVMEQLGIFFAKSIDRAPTTSSSLHKAPTSAVASKMLKAQRNWFQDKRNKRIVHRPGVGCGLLGSPNAVHGNTGGLLGGGPMVHGSSYGPHNGPYGRGYNYNRFNYKGQYRNYQGNERDFASSVGLLVNLSQMLAHQVQHQQQYGQQRPSGTQNMYNHGDYSRGGKFGQQGSDRVLNASGHYEGYGSNGQYHQNRPFYSGY